MIIALCTLGMVGTAVAQNPLFSFVRNKMIEDQELSLWKNDKEICTSKELRRLSALYPAGSQFDCVESASFTWHCTG